MSVRKRAKWAYLVIAPFFIVYLIFSLYPMVYSIYMSFCNMDPISGKTSFIGTPNYSRLFTSLPFYQSIWNTLVIWTMSIVPQLSIAFTLSLLLHNKWFKGRSIFRNIYYFPNLVTPVTIGLLFGTLFTYPSGSVNQILELFGLQPIDFQNNPWLARMVIAIAICWKNFGFNIIYFTAGLHSIPNDVYEAAEVDGANAWKKMSHITIPMMRPMLLYVLITSVIGGLQVFDVAKLVFSDVPGDAHFTMVYYLYESTFSRFQFGYGAAVAVGVFLVILMASGVAYGVTNLKFGRRKAVDAN